MAGETYFDEQRGSWFFRSNSPLDDAQEQIAAGAKRYEELFTRYSAQTAQIAELNAQLVEREEQLRAANEELERSRFLRVAAAQRWAARRVAQSVEIEARVGYMLLGHANAYGEAVERDGVQPCRLPDVPRHGWRLLVEGAVAALEGAEPVTNEFGDEMRGCYEVDAPLLAKGLRRVLGEVQP